MGLQSNDASIVICSDGRVQQTTVVSKPFQELSSLKASTRTIRISTDSLAASLSLSSLASQPLFLSPSRSLIEGVLEGGSSLTRDKLLERWGQTTDSQKRDATSSVLSSSERITVNVGK